MNGNGNQRGGDKLDGYVPVSERVDKFYQKHPEGRILTTVVEHDREAGFIMFRAEVYRNPEDTMPAATGHAYEYKDAGYVQKSSYIETGETSAIGRALAFLNFETKRGIASREEIEKAVRAREDEPLAARDQIDVIESLAKEKGVDVLKLIAEHGFKRLDELPRVRARKLIGYLEGQ